jgi:hypothetical protein
MADEEEQPTKQEGLDCGSCYVIVAAKPIPPFGDQIADAADCCRDIFWQPRPRLIGIDAGDRLKQKRREILPAGVLDLSEQLIDAKIGGVDRGLASGQKPNVIIQCGAATRISIRCWLRNARDGARWSKPRASKWNDLRTPRFAGV